MIIYFLYFSFYIFIFILFNSFYFYLFFQYTYIYFFIYYLFIYIYIYIYIYFFAYFMFIYAFSYFTISKFQSIHNSNLHFIISHSHLIYKNNFVSSAVSVDLVPFLSLISRKFTTWLVLWYDYTQEGLGKTGVFGTLNG